MPGDDRGDVDNARELEEGISPASLKLHGFTSLILEFLTLFQITFNLIMHQTKTNKTQEPKWSFRLMKTIITWLFKPSLQNGF